MPGEGCLRAEGTEVELNDAGVVQQLTSRTGVRVFTLIQDICSVTNLEAPPGVLLNHDGGHAGFVNL